MERYLTKKQHEAFSSFLKQRKIRRAEVARILNLKSSASVTQYFKHFTFRVTDADKVKRVLRDRALEGFDDLEF